MANTTNIHIRKSTTTAIPPTGNLEIGELAYSYVSNTMFIGGSDELGVLPVGGYSEYLRLSDAYDLTNLSLSIANTANSTAAGVLAGGLANYAFDSANAAYTYAANVAMSAANAAFAKANAANITADSTYTYTANNVRLIANSAYDKANSVNIIAVAAFDKANTGTSGGAAFDTANAAFDKANSANLLALSSYTFAANNAMLAANSAYAAANATWTYAANNVMSAANAAYASQNATYTYSANVVMSAANAAFAMANAANLIPVGNTMANGYWTIRSTRRRINFIPGSLITINVNDDPTLNTSNVVIDATAADPQYAFAKANLAYTYAANNAMIAANAAYALANSTWTFAANNVRLIANSAYAAGNTTYTYAANNVMRAANSAYAAGNTTYTYAANVVMSAANAAYAAQNTTYGYASNVVMSAANAAFAMANAANLMPVGNTISNGYFSVRSTRRRINFLEGTNVTITVDDDATLNTANITISAATGSDPLAPLAYAKANAAYTFAANDAMLAANSAFAQANAANLIPVGNTMSNGYHTIRATRRKINFLEGTNVTITVDDDPTINAANITISAATGSDPLAPLAFAKANLAYTYAANDAMLAANSAYDKANAANITADATYTYAANVVLSAANAAFAMANAANLMPVGNTIFSNSYFTVRATRRRLNFIPGAGHVTINVNDDATLNTSNIIINTTEFGAAYALANATWTYAANNVMLVANSAYAAQNSTYTFAANTVRLIANSAYAAQNTTYTYAANVVMSAANAAFSQANGANLIPVGNTMSNGYHTIRATRRKLNFIPGSLITINVNDDPTINSSNIIIDATAADPQYAFAKANLAYTYAANDAMLAANSAYAAANSTWTYAANIVMSAANSAYAAQNTTYTYAANTVMLAANSAYAAQNTTYTYAANVAMSAANAAYAAQNTTYTFAANTVRLIANSAYAAANATWTYAANTVMLAANSAYTVANLANQTANNAFSNTSGSVFNGDMFVKGNVGIGVYSTTYKLEVAGSFAAQTKSFIINHPSNPGMKLQYAALEGPENGVYVRGKLSGQSSICLPGYWFDLVDPDTITVHLTPYSFPQPNLHVSDVYSSSIYLSESAWCYYIVYAERKDVPKLIVEF